MGLGLGGASQHPGHQQALPSPCHGPPTRPPGPLGPWGLPTHGRLPPLCSQEWGSLSTCFTLTFLGPYDQRPGLPGAGGPQRLARRKQILGCQETADNVDGAPGIPEPCSRRPGNFVPVSQGAGNSCLLRDRELQGRGGQPAAPGGTVAWGGPGRPGEGAGWGTSARMRRLPSRPQPGRLVQGHLTATGLVQGCPAGGPGLCPDFTAAWLLHRGHTVSLGCPWLCLPGDQAMSLGRVVNLAPGSVGLRVACTGRQVAPPPLALVRGSWPW